MLYQIPRQHVSKLLLKDEYARAEVPVFEMPFRRYAKLEKDPVAKAELRSSRFMGEYVVNEDIKGMPPRYIVINKAMPNYEKLMVLWHEVGHHSCVKARCLCAKYGFEFRKTELHAELACIYIAHQRNRPELLLALIKEAVGDLLNNGERSFNYIRNATMMVKHPLFIEAKDSVATEFNKWINQHRSLKKRYEVALADTATRMCRWHPTNYLKRFAKQT